MSSVSSKHLDLGCGLNPRNPYQRQQLFGLDVRDDMAAGVVGCTIVKGNVALEPIPFADNFFGSVSAFDFLEHIPRQLYRESRNEIFYPFVNLMSEVWRVLTPGGVFLAVTPAYPKAGAFVDPTHVNIITSRTHDYFCGPNATAKMYGFKGEFRAKLVKFTAHSNVVSNPRPARFRQLVRDLHRRVFRDGLHHLVWELEAVKP